MFIITEYTGNVIGVYANYLEVKLALKDNDKELLIEEYDDNGICKSYERLKTYL